MSCRPVTTIRRKTKPGKARVVCGPRRDCVAAMDPASARRPHGRHDQASGRAAARQQLEGKLAPSTIGRTYSTLRAVLNLAVDRELLLRSPARGTRLPSVPNVRRHVPTPDELVALADTHPVEYEAMVWLERGQQLEHLESGVPTAVHPVRLEDQRW